MHPGGMHRNIFSCMMLQFFFSCSHFLPMAGMCVEHIECQGRLSVLEAHTYVVECQKLQPLSVLLDVNDAPETSEHGWDVEKVVLHGVLPSGASLKSPAELCLFSLQDSDWQKKKVGFHGGLPNIGEMNLKLCLAGCPHI